jgi:hypothetical protein
VGNSRDHTWGIPVILDIGAAAAQDLRAVFPEHALSDLLDHQAAATAATGDLLRASNAAYASGRGTLSVPAVLAGGRLGFDAPAGLVRETLVTQLDELVRADLQPRPPP